MVDRRGSAASRGYDHHWRKLRAWHLAQHPLCVFCHRAGRVMAATVVDHIERIQDAPHRRLDPTNLQSLCKTCHDSVKQSQERGGAPAVGEDGWPVSRWDVDRQRRASKGGG